MLLHENKLRNRAHRNRLRQIDGIPLPGAGADGDGDDEEEQPPVGGGGGPATTPGTGGQTTAPNDHGNTKPTSHTSTSTTTTTRSQASSTTTRSTTTTTTTSQSVAPPPDNQNNAQPTSTDPLPGASQPTNPGTIYNPTVGGGYVNTYTPGGATIITQPTGLPADTTPEKPSNTIKYIGYAAGAIAGFALLVAFIMFIMRRLNKKRENEALGDVFDRNSFVRDSVAIPDHGGDDHPSDRGRPRPPTMIARHIGATGGNNTPFAGGYDGGYGGAAVPPMPDNGGYYGNNGGYNGNNGGYNGNGYDQYGTGHGAGHGYNGEYDHQYDQYGHYAPPQQGYASYQDSPMHSPMDPYADHGAHSAQYLNHQVGSEYPAMPPAAVGSPTDSGRTLTRQPSSGAPGADYHNVAELGRGTSVTPYQAAQYAEISKRLDDPNPNGGPAYHKPGQHRQPTLDDAYGGI